MSAPIVPPSPRRHGKRRSVLSRVRLRLVAHHRRPRRQLVVWLVTAALVVLALELVQYLRIRNS